MTRLPRKKYSATRSAARAEVLMRMARVSDLAEAHALLQDASESVQRRCLAARIAGLIGDEASSEALRQTVLNEDPRLQRCRDWGWSHLYRRERGKRDQESRERAQEKMDALGWSSLAAVRAALSARTADIERRAEAAYILGSFQCREALLPLIDAVAEGDRDLAWAASHALIGIGSRRGGRQLVRIAAGNASLHARQAAIYAIWMLNETRAESVLIRIALDERREEERIRGMAAEALGVTGHRLCSQHALATLLKDPSIDVRYSALCALGCSLYSGVPRFLAQALEAKLQDPARLDDDRIVSELAGEILGRSRE